MIVCSVRQERYDNPVENLRWTLGERAYEVIRIADAWSMCVGYNQGLPRARGGRLIFCHDDIEILSEDFVTRLDAHFQRFDVFGRAGTTCMIDGWWVAAGVGKIRGSVVKPSGAQRSSYQLFLFSEHRAVIAEAQGLDGVFIAATRDAADWVGWDAERVPGFHLYDVDFSFRAHLGGLRVGIACDLLVFHASGGTYDDRWKRAVADWRDRMGPFLSDYRKLPDKVVGLAYRDKAEPYRQFKLRLETEPVAASARLGS